MSFSLEVGRYFGYAILIWVPGHYLLNWILGAKVGSARKALDVPVPNLYATPGKHKHANEFNAIQRGHQNMLEHLPALQMMAIIGSLYGERAALANIVGGLFSLAGHYLYQVGYAKYHSVTKGVPGRYKTGGSVKFIGHLIALVTSVMMCLSLVGK